MSKRSDFRVGDRVWHSSRQSVGVVESNDRAVIVIRFEDLK